MLGLKIFEDNLQQNSVINSMRYHITHFTKLHNTKNISLGVIVPKEDIKISVQQCFQECKEGLRQVFKIARILLKFGIQ